MVQYSQINKRNTSHKQKGRENHMIISIDEEKEFDKIQHQTSSQDGGIGRHTVPPHTTKRRKMTN